MPSVPIWRSDDHISIGAAFSDIENELAGCDEQIRKEWNALKGDLKPSDTPLHNDPKNRYPGLNYLVEKHVVSLKSGAFIHASKIELGDLRYIAMQAPLRRTIADVWQMVFEQQAPVMVNLVHAHEMDSPNATNDGACAYYWPPNRSSITLANGLTISLVGEFPNKNYVERRIRILQNSTGSEHLVTHLHYPYWPDGGITEPTQLLALIRRTIDFMNGPAVVHCREGIGRAGTFIASHFLLQNPQANAFDVVSTMRKMRSNMVGTIDQYRMVKAAELLSRK